MTDDCAFCRIVRGESDAHVVYEDDRAIAFLDQNPAVEGHVLVAPKGHREGVLTGDETVAKRVFGAVRAVSQALEAAFDTQGISVFYSTGSLVGNVEHAHVHVLPRRTDDDVHVALPRQRLSDREGDRISAKLRAQL